MEKTCFECGMKGETLTGPVFFPADKLRAFYLELGVSDPIVDKMQNSNLLCSKCAGKAECRHALKCYEYYKEKWTPEQYEIWAKNNAHLISIAETELKEQEKISVYNPVIEPTSNIPHETTVNVEKLAVITGRWASGQENPSGVFLGEELQRRFEDFLKDHKGKIIDWNVTQESHSGNWVIFVRYTT